VRTVLRALAERGVFANEGAHGGAERDQSCARAQRGDGGASELRADGTFARAFVPVGDAFGRPCSSPSSRMRRTRSSRSARARASLRRPTLRTRLPGTRRRTGAARWCDMAHLREPREGRAPRMKLHP
jgi:hypothetical protein